MKVRVYVPEKWTKKDDPFIRMYFYPVFYWDFPDYWTFARQKFRITYRSGISVTGLCSSDGTISLPDGVGCLRALCETDEDLDDCLHFRVIEEIEKMELLDGKEIKK